MKRMRWIAVCALMTIEFTACAVADTIFTNLQFMTGSTAGTEVLNLAAPGQLLSGGSFQYSTMNDATAAKLVSENADKKDFILSGVSTFGALGAATVRLSPTGNAGRVIDNHSFTGTVGANNPGSLDANTFTLMFGSHLNVTNATFNFSSFNTAGIAWEYSVIQFLDVNGNPFSTLTNPGWTLGANSQYLTAGAGFSGAAGVGNFIAGSTGTVTGVGTNLTASGTNGTNDSFGSFGYSSVGLAANTRIGGIRWTTYLEDVRGTGNGNTSFTSSLLDFTISGSIASVPERSSMGGVALLIGLGLIGRRFMRHRTIRG